jgi:hypothetical protein
MFRKRSQILLCSAKNAVFIQFLENGLITFRRVFATGFARLRIDQPNRGYLQTELERPEEPVTDQLQRGAVGGAWK